jgi:glutathione synthase/RimK-type ligase-like ATP-grasp enzyme
MLLGYEKVADDSDGTGDLNPLHQTGSVAVRVTDAGLLERLSEVAAAVAGVLDLGFFAVDLIDGEGGLHILEVNPNPICYFYNQCNGRQDFTGIYRRLLRKYVTAP